MECNNRRPIINNPRYLVGHDSAVHNMNYIRLEVLDLEADLLLQAEVYEHSSLEAIHICYVNFQANSPKTVNLLFDKNA